MKLATLVGLVAQVAYVVSMPAVAERNDELSSLENRQEIPDTLETRGSCFYSSPQPENGCSSGGWCYSRCTRSGRSTEWCWLAYKRGKGDWVSCKSNGDCSIAVNKVYAEAATCSSDQCKNCGCYCN